MRIPLNFYALATATILLGATVASAQSNKSSNAKSSYAGLLSASKLKGADVYNLQNESIGEVEEVLLDPASGRVRFAVVEVGGFLGMGATNVAVPWSAFHISREGDDVKYVVDASKDKLEKAPRVEGKSYDRLYSRKDAEPSYVYWGVTWFEVEPVASPSPGVSPQSSPAASPKATVTTKTTPSPSPAK